MKTAHDIILKPVITEASMQGIANKKYTFQVAKDANKIEIAKAVAELFGVKVAKVNTINVNGKYRRQGHQGRLHSGLEKSHRNPDRGFQEHRVLRFHDVMPEGIILPRSYVWDSLRASRENPKGE